MQLFFTPLSQALRLVIHLGEPLPEDRPSFQFDFRGLFALFVFSFLLMMWTNGVGASTGMFVPALAVGAVGEPPPCQAPLMCACRLSHTLPAAHKHKIVHEPVQASLVGLQAAWWLSRLPLHTVYCLRRGPLDARTCAAVPDAVSGPQQRAPAMLLQAAA